MKKTVLLSGFLAISFIFFGCPQVTMLGQIDKETKLEEAVIKGLVGSVVYFKDNLYACDGNIYVKNADAVRGWSKVDALSGHIIKLAADATNLYAMSVTTDNANKTTKQLHTTTDGKTWKLVTLASGEEIITIFDTGSAFNADSDSGTNSTAYIEIKNGETVSYKQLNGSSTHTPSKTPKSSIVSGDYYAIKEGTKDKPQWVIKGAGDTTLTSGKGTIHSIALSSDKSTLYVATNAGVKSYTVADKTEKTLPGPNAPSMVKSSYNYFAVFAYGDAYGDAIYAAPALEGNVGSGVNGLFGYYESRGNWNVE